MAALWGALGACLQELLSELYAPAPEVYGSHAESKRCTLQVHKIRDAVGLPGF